LVLRFGVTGCWKGVELITNQWGEQPAVVLRKKKKDGRQSSSAKEKRLLRGQGIQHLKPRTWEVKEKEK